jgi:hypothetical protein
MAEHLPSTCRVPGFNLQQHTHTYTNTNIRQLQKTIKVKSNLNCADAKPDKDNIRKKTFYKLQFIYSKFFP